MHFFVQKQSSACDLLMGLHLCDSKIRSYKGVIFCIVLFCTKMCLLQKSYAFFFFYISIDIQFLFSNNNVRFVTLFTIQNGSLKKKISCVGWQLAHNWRIQGGGDGAAPSPQIFFCCSHRGKWGRKEHTFSLICFSVVWWSD